MPARTSPGQTRSALPSHYPGGSDKLARGRRVVKIGSANVGTMTGRSEEVVEMVDRRQLDVCCLQETRWKGDGATTIGRYKFLWAGSREGKGGVGFLVRESWVDKVLQVKRCSERIMVLRIRVGKLVLCVVSVYAPQVGRPMEEKEEFFASLGEVLSAVDGKERLVVCGDMNGHVGAGKDGFEGVHGGYGYGERNPEGEMLLEFADAMKLVIANTWFRKKDHRLVTYESGGCRTVVDYILVRKAEMRGLTNATVVRSEPSLQQHKLLIGTLQLEGCGHVKEKKVFVSKCKVWKLKNPEIRQAFEAEVRERAERRVVGEGDVEGMWQGLKECLLEVSAEVCGKTRGRPMHRETWWWNDEVAELVKEKRRLFKVYDKAKRGIGNVGIQESKRMYETAKRAAKRGIVKAKEAQQKEFGENLDEEDRRGTVFRVAKQIAEKNRDVVGGGCMRDMRGKIVVEADEILEVWRTHYEKLSNEEFPWDREALPAVEAINESYEGEEITVEEVQSAIKKMRNNKAAGPSEVVAEMLKAAGDAGTMWITDICNRVVREGRIPEDWCKSWMVNVYKGKGDALECGSYRGIRLLEHVLKVLERVIEARVRKIVKIDDMQFGFMPGRGTMDAIFIVRQLQEKFLAKKKDLWMAFIDLEKAFDRVPREVVWWALRTLGVDEWLVTVIRAMYADTSTMVKLSGRVSNGFEVKVGVHQGSVLSPLLFIIVMEALSRTFRGGLPMELLYADDLVLIADSEDLLIEKIKKWKAGIEDKGLRVNMGKTKVMRCRVDTGRVVKSGVYPCGVCCKGVGRVNAIECSACKAWIHGRCSGIKGSLTRAHQQQYRCIKCTSGKDLVGETEMPRRISLGDGQDLECVGEFCYLGDMIGAGGGAGEATRVRVRCGWSKFRQLAPVLTSRGASLKVKGKVYRTCVQRVMVYGSETWPMKVEDVQRLERAERMMVRWMCGVRLRNRIASEELNSRLGIVRIGEIVRRGRLGWFGHLERKGRDDWVSRCRRFEVMGPKSKGRSRKTWDECVRHDLQSGGLDPRWTQNKTQWRSLITGNPSDPCTHGEAGVRGGARHGRKR